MGGMRLDKKSVKAVEVDIARVEKKHGRVLTQTVMQRYLNRMRAQRKLEREIAARRRELDALEAKRA